MSTVSLPRRYNTPPTHASLTVGQEVQVHAFGCWFPGDVLKKTRTKVVVQFATSGGMRSKTVATSHLALAGTWELANRYDGSVILLVEGETIEQYDARLAARTASLAAQRLA